LGRFSGGCLFFEARSRAKGIEKAARVSGLIGGKSGVENYMAISFFRLVAILMVFYPLIELSLAL